MQITHLPSSLDKAPEQKKQFLLAYINKCIQGTGQLADGELAAALFYAQLAYDTVIKERKDTLKKAQYLIEELEKNWVTINGNHIWLGGDDQGKAQATGGVVATVARETKDNGGATVDVTGFQPKAGYAVSPYKGVETKISAAEFNQSHVESFMQEHQALLNKVDHYVGSWYNEEDGHIYLDVSVVKPEAADAVRIARSANQLAVFNLGDFTEIKADEYGKYEKNYKEEEDILKSQDGGREDHGSYSKSNPQENREEIAHSLKKIQTILQDIQKGWVTINGAHIFIGEGDTSLGSQHKAITNWEASHATATTESIFVFNPKTGEGKEIGQSSKDGVNITEEEFGMIKDNIYTHNHPGGHESLSQADVENAYRAQAKEVRVVSKTGVASMTFPHTSPATASIVANSIKYSLPQGERNSGIPQVISHSIWDRVAENLGTKYAFVPFKAVKKTTDLEKGWVTINGRHIFFPDGGDAAGKGGKGSIGGLTSAQVHDSILAHAKENPNVKNPEKLANDLTKKYEQAAVKKQTLDKIAAKVTAEIPGSTVAEATLKGFYKDGSFNPSRAIEKFNQAGDIKDLARNAILVNSAGDAEIAKGLLEKNGVIIEDGKNYFKNPTYLGYRGMNGNHVDANGIGEVQVHVPEVLYYKEPTAMTKPVFGEKLFNQVKAVADKNGLVAGEGHQIYETVRKVEDKAIAEGRSTTQQNGRVTFEWTPAEQAKIFPLVQQSSQGYTTALRLAEERANRK